MLWLGLGTKNTRLGLGKKIKVWFTIIIWVARITDGDFRLPVNNSLQLLVVALMSQKNIWKPSLVSLKISSGVTQSQSVVR